jgi:hypothetical protein
MPENDTQSVDTNVRKKDPELLAKLVVRDRKQFKESALAAGYSLSLACRGLARAMECSSAIATAVENENNRLIADLKALKPISVQRLYDEIVNPRSSMGIKAIELAGRFKETDWWVRNAELQVGVFTQIGDSGSGEAINTITQYKEEDEE